MLVLQGSADLTSFRGRRYAKLYRSLRQAKGLPHLRMISATQTFENHEVLLIGANGFVGKVLLAMLIDRFPTWKHLHILVRSRPGVSAAERFTGDVLTSLPLKGVVARADPALLRDRITIHSGDIAQPHCGLSASSREQLRGRVSLIINSAGLVEFFAPVDESFQSNVDGVERVIGLALDLDAKLVHVSTCFVCGESDGLVEEDEPIAGFYPHRRGADDAGFQHQDEVRFMRDRIREVYEQGAARGLAPKEVRQRLIDLGKQRAAQWGWVNTYTYSKSLGEQIIASTPGLEYSLVRPAIVEAALEFPFPGWVEGGRTAAPLVMMAMAGMRHWPLRGDAPLEVVPVDQVASAILTAAVLLMNGCAERVYQAGTADVNPVALGQLVRWMWAMYRRRKHLYVAPGVRMWPPHRAQRHYRKERRRVTALQKAVVGLRRVVQRSGLPGRRQLSHLGASLRMLGLQAAIREQMLDLYQPFLYDNRFVFEAHNLRAAHLQLSGEDRRRLPWTPERIQWRRYWCENEVAGIEKYVKAEMTKGWTFQV
jgi:long-chain acyl-CoA synthetase